VVTTTTGLPMPEYCCDLIKQYVENNLPIGSHYHCSGCDAVTGMYGHFTTICKVRGKEQEFHACCPGNCKLDSGLDNQVGGTV
jgi:hypothetical protein